MGGERDIQNEGGRDKGRGRGSLKEIGRGPGLLAFATSRLVSRLLKPFDWLKAKIEEWRTELLEERRLAEAAEKRATEASSQAMGLTSRLKEEQMRVAMSEQALREQTEATGQPLSTSIPTPSKVAHVVTSCRSPAT